MNSHLTDEILEAVWVAKENGQCDADNLVIDCAHDVGPYNLPDSLIEMTAMDLLSIDGQEINFTTEGERKARNLIRRNRLAKRLLMDVLDVSEEMSKEMACEFEHFLEQ